MPNNDSILDYEEEKKPKNDWSWLKLSIQQHLRWHLILFCFLILLYSFITTVTFLFDKYELIMSLSLGFLILSTLGITYFVCYKGFEWGPLTTFMEGSIVFFFGFISTMNHLDELVNKYTPYMSNQLGWSTQTANVFLDIMLVGISYWLLAIIAIEFFHLFNNIITLIGRKVWGANFNAFWQEKAAISTNKKAN